MKFPIPQVVHDLHREIQRRLELPDARLHFAENAEFLNARLAEMTPGEVESYEFLGELKRARFFETREAMLKRLPHGKPVFQWIDDNLLPGETVREFCERTGASIGELIDRFPSLAGREDQPMGV